MPNEFVARNGIIALNNTIVTGSVTATTGFTGSLFGTASWAQNSVTASFLLGSVASSSYAYTASSAVSSSYALTASYALNAGAATTIVTGSNAILSQSTAALTWSFDHNLNNRYPVFQVFNSASEVVIPQRIVATSTTNALIYFSTPVSGIAVADIGGYTGSAASVSASYAYTASSAVSSSYALTASFLLGAATGFPFTGSAQITGSVGITGSFAIGSNILTNSGSSYFIVSHSLVQPSQTGSQIADVNITPTFTYNAPNQTQTALRVRATFTGSSNLTSSQSNIIADIGATSVGSQFLVNDVTSGSIYMVNDVSGLPIIEANSNWDVFIYDYPNVVFKKTGSVLELGNQGNPSSSILVKSDLVINEGMAFSHTSSQASGSTVGAVTSSLYNIRFGNASASVYMHAIVTGYDTGSRDTITGDIKGTIRYRAGVATMVGVDQTFVNSDAQVVNFDIAAGSTSGSLLVYGTGSRAYQWGATVVTQII